MKFVINNKSTNKFHLSLILITITLLFITNTTQITVKHKHSQIFYKNKYYDYGDETLLIEKSVINKEKGYIKPNIIIPKYKSISKSIDERDNVPELDYSSSSEINSSSNEFLPASQQSNTSISEVGSGQSIVFDDINKELHTYKSASILHNNDIINPNNTKENELSKLNKNIISVTNSNINEIINSSDEKNQIKGKPKILIDLINSSTQDNYNNKVDKASLSSDSRSFLKQTSPDISKESQLKQINKELNIKDSSETLMFNEISQVRKPISEMSKAKSLSDNSHPNVYFADNDLEYLISKKIRESKDTHEFTKINLKENKSSKEARTNDINHFDAVIKNKNNKEVMVDFQWKQKLEKLLNELESNLIKNPQDYEFYFKDTQYEFKQVLIANKLLDPSSYRIKLIGDLNEKKLKELEIKEKLENKYLNLNDDLNKEEMTQKIEVIDIKESKHEDKIDEKKNYSSSAINNVNINNTAVTNTNNANDNVNVNVNKLIKEYNLTFNDKTNNSESKLNDIKTIDKSNKNLNLNKKKIVKRKIDTINVELKANQPIKNNVDKSNKEINEKDNINKLLLNKETKELIKDINRDSHLNDLINKANSDSKAVKSGLDNKISTNITKTQEGISTNNKEKELIIKNEQANNPINNKSDDYKFKFKEAKHKKVDYHKLSSDDVDNKSVLSELLKSLS